MFNLIHPARKLASMGLVAAMLVAACGGSSNTTAGPIGTNATGATGGTLTSGLAANLDGLDNYQFSWQFSASSNNGSGAAMPSASSLTTSGTVVNKPIKAYKVNNLGMMQIIVIGSDSWMSYDNGSSYTADPTYANDGSLKDLLPTALYGQDFDTFATDYKAVGNETKNGVDCIHYQGGSNLGAASALSGVSATFKADLWVARSGNYPVSGFYGWTGSANGESGSWGYSFDIIHVNDPANTISAPTNVTALPSN